MKKTVALCLLCFLPGVLFGQSDKQALTGQKLIDSAQSAQAAEYDFALKLGAEITVTPDEKSFYVFWKPKNYSASTPLVVSIHGHGSWAVRDFYMWYPYIQDRGYALLTLQWWRGTGEETADYFRPEEMYRMLDQVFREKNIQAPALLHGFSRGSANTYALAALDVHSGNRYFDLFIANAGKANEGYPPNQAIQKGRMGPSPLAGTRWITVAGGKDKHQERDGIAGMRETQSWLKKYGADIILAIEDPDGDHGVFHRNPKNVAQALDAFDKLTQKVPEPEVRSFDHGSSTDVEAYRVESSR